MIVIRPPLRLTTCQNLTTPWGGVNLYLIVFFFVLIVVFEVFRISMRPFSILVLVTFRNMVFCRGPLLGALLLSFLLHFIKSWVLR